MLRTDSIIKAPTIIKAGAVAALGMSPTNGVKNMDNKNSEPQTTAVRPVRPPTPTPAALSTKAVMVLVPKSEPMLTPAASVSIALPMPGKRPVLSIRPAFVAIPTIVPMASKSSTKVKVKIIVKSPIFKAPIISKAKKALRLKSGMETGEKPAGILTIPVAMPASEVSRMPIKIAPFT